MKKVVNKLKPKSVFTKNVLTLMTGTTIAQAIPIAISPILTRLYSPKDFGVFALFVAITSIFGTIANGRYELAIMLPRKDEDAINIFALGFIINICLSSLLFLIVSIFHDYLVKLLNNKEISPWLYFIPLSVFLIGCFNLLNYFNNRLKKYKDLAKANIYKSIGCAIIQLSLGIFKSGALGLISGQIFSQIVSNTKLFLNIKRLNLFKYIKTKKILFFTKRYKDFPKFSSLSAIMNTTSLQLPILVITKFFLISNAGFFSLANRVLNMPMIFIGSSIGQVYFQKASIYKNDINKLQNLTVSIYNKLRLIAILPFSVLIIYGDLIFSFVFGKNWELAGKIGQILGIWLYIVFITSPLTTLFTVLEMQKEGAFFDFILIITRFIALLVGALIFNNFIISIILYACVGIVLWTFWNLYLFYQIKISILPSFIMLYGRFSMTLILVGGIRWFIFT